MNTEDSTNSPPKTLALCPECQAGILRLQHKTYFTWLNSELVTVPNFPAWVCDVCGRREYDERAIVWLNTLLNPDTGRRLRARRQVNRPPRPRPDRPQP